MKANKTGISLIVLVITIIVMIILASAIIITLTNTGIIGRANEAVEGMNLAQVKEMANLAWAKLYLDGEEITETTIRDQLKLDGMSDEQLNKYKIDLGANGVTITLKGDATVQLNEYGFYYDMLYTWEQPDSEGNIDKWAASFNSDGTAALYMDMSWLEERYGVDVSATFNGPSYVCQMAGEADFSDKTISIMIYGMTCVGVFEDEGTTCKFTLPGSSTETVAKLSTTSLCGGPTYNRVYSGTFVDSEDVDIAGDIDSISIVLDRESNQVILTYNNIETETLGIKNIVANGHYIELTNSTKLGNIAIFVSQDGKHIFLGASIPVELTNEVHN